LRAPTKNSMARYTDITSDRLESGDDGRIQVQSPDKDWRVRWMIGREALGVFSDGLAGRIRDAQYNGIVLTLEAALDGLGKAQAKAWGPLAGGKQTVESVLLEVINRRIADPELRANTIALYRQLGLIA